MPEHEDVRPPSSWLPLLKRSPSKDEIQVALSKIAHLLNTSSLTLQDPLERHQVLSWLNRLTSSGEFEQEIVDSAADLLEQIVNPQSPSEPTTPDDASIERTFLFPFDYTRPNALHDRSAIPSNAIAVTLVDEELPASTTNDTDRQAALAVGVQTWAAAIVLSDAVVTRGEEVHERLVRGCAHDERLFSVLELGAGTGLVGLVTARVLHQRSIPAKVTLTDYHPLVLSNLERNARTNDKTPSVQVTTSHLDWSAYHNGTSIPPHLPQDLLLAADVVYSPEHAKWLYSTIFHLLARNTAARAHVLNAKREQGRFGEWDLVRGTDEAFDEDRVGGDGKRLSVIRRLELEKSKGLGRSDESGHVWWVLAWV